MRTSRRRERKGGLGKRGKMGENSSRHYLDATGKEKTVVCSEGFDCSR